MTSETLDTVVRPIPAGTDIEQRSDFGWALIDTWEMVKRNLRHIPRSPELLIDVTVQPVIFVLLFTYIFGGAISVPGGSYVNYLMAGIFVQTLLFAAMSSGIGLSYDLQKGLIDRFRTLPMSQAAVLGGRTLTDLLRGSLAMVLMFLVGLLVGFRPEGEVWKWIAAFALLLLFCFAFSWVGVTVGMSVGSPEAVQGIVFMVILPLTFASSAFVPTDTMPDWLQTFANNQPITKMVDTLRAAFLDQPMRDDALSSLAWSILLLVIFMPLGINLYRKRTTD